MAQCKCSSEEHDALKALSVGEFIASTSEPSGGRYGSGSLEGTVWGNCTSGNTVMKYRDVDWDNEPTVPAWKMEADFDDAPTTPFAQRQVA